MNTLTKQLLLVFSSIIFLLLLHSFTGRMASDYGAFFISKDEISRAWYAMWFIESAEFKSFDYTWLPLPFYTIGHLGSMLGDEYVRATRMLNNALCVITVLAGFFAIYAVSKNWVSSLIGGVIAVTAPWQTFGGIMGFAGPHAWAGIMISIFCLCYLSNNKTIITWYFLTIFGAVGTALACLSRYEVWLFAPGYVAGLLLIAGMCAINEDTESQKRTFSRKIALTKLPAILISALIVFYPIVWWLSIQNKEFGDCLRPFELTHFFAIDGVGQANKTITATQLYTQANPYCFWIPVLALISLAKRKWTLPYFFLVAPVLLHLMAMVYFSYRSGIGWIHGYRVLGFHSIALAFPAGIVLTEWFFASEGCDEDEFWKNWKEYLKPERVAAFLIFGAIVSTQLVLTRIPIKGNYTKFQITQSYLLRLVNESNLTEPVTIAVPPGDLILDHWALLEHSNYKLIQVPQDIYDSFNSDDTSGFVQWMKESNVAFFTTNSNLEEIDGLKQHEDGLTIDQRIAGVRERNDAFVLVTHNQSTVPPPDSVYSLLNERGLQGPQKDAYITRYRAVVPPNGSPAQAMEVSQNDHAQNYQELFLTIHKRPELQRSGWPGNYLIRLQPSDFGSTSILQIGNEVIHPRFNGYYLFSFDVETGKQTDFFYLNPDGIHPIDSDHVHYPTYSLAE